MALFVARNRDRLLAGFDAHMAGGWPFCWPGLVAPQAWFLYRKMYLWAALVSAGPLALGYFPKWGFLEWGTSALGAFGLKLYFAGAERAIARIRAETESEAEAQALIARAGGVSAAGAALGLVFAFVAFILSLKAGALRLP